MPEEKLIKEERTFGHQLFQRFSSFFGKIYSTQLNPLYNLGSIAILMFVIACISGIFVFIFYNINPRHAWSSVEDISNNFFNGWMRNIHRYSSDLLVIFILLHLAHTLFTSKFKRLVSWISGIISFLIVIIIGVTGFILVTVADHFVVFIINDKGYLLVFAVVDAGAVHVPVLVVVFLINGAILIVGNSFSFQLAVYIRFCLRKSAIAEIVFPEPIPLQVLIPSFYLRFAVVEPGGIGTVGIAVF